MAGPTISGMGGLYETPYEYKNISAGAEVYEWLHPERPKDGKDLELRGDSLGYVGDEHIVLLPDRVYYITYPITKK